ncbi:flagellar biosynthetic protein FliR [Pectinatus haikarae]|uniref:Flagellar biosynthetic protein FliR n=1 Tax=Pectinatus haikarae TaxID=349096 RepID=A0ABT9Y7F5_9FIRM|nr:flagellar biosynthetic protein FliR [Pectinatus haikarae]MDQ0203765.1 flagellar biosynthetic protein FliR [Pectinatus haikarae]
MDLFDMLQNHVGLFLLVLTRISGIFLISPFLGSVNIPVNIRVGTAFFISIVLFPVIEMQGLPALPQRVDQYAALVVAELLIGWMIGFVGYVLFSAINVGGQLIDMQVGFATISVMDPTSGQQVPLVGSFLYNLCILIFLSVNGHYIILSALSESFMAVPAMSAQFDGRIVMFMIDIIGGVFATGLKLALPVLFAILLTNVGLGVLARTMPQMNIFVVGIPAQIIIGIFVIGIMLPFYALFLDVIFNELYGGITAMLRAISG